MPKKNRLPRSLRPSRLSPRFPRSAKGILIFTLFAFTIGLGLLAWGGDELRRALSSNRWPSTTGTVIRSYVHEVERHNEEKMESTFYPIVLYRYSVFGESYTADRIAFGGYPGGSRTHAQKLVDGYPAGIPLTVYYDPNEPAMAVLKGGYSWMAYGVVGAGLIFLAGAMVGLRAWSRKFG